MAKGSDLALFLRNLTLSGGQEDLDECVQRLSTSRRIGLNEIALDLHGDPSRAIRQLGERVLPYVQKGEQ